MPSNVDLVNIYVQLLLCDQPTAHISDPTQMRMKLMLNMYTLTVVDIHITLPRLHFCS